MTDDTPTPTAEEKLEEALAKFVAQPWVKDDIRLCLRAAEAAAREPLEQVLNELHVLSSQGKMVAVERTGNPHLPYRYSIVKYLDTSEKHVHTLEQRIGELEKDKERLKAGPLMSIREAREAARAEGRREGLEEAAKVADLTAHYLDCSYHETGEPQDCDCNSGIIAAAIRAMEDEG
jgi:flagellar biosynthesis/type III secretory pathway protein FliH